MSKIADWLHSVNQPVVDEALHQTDRLIELISDGGNFSESECEDILIKITISRRMSREGLKDKKNEKINRTVF